MTGCFPIVRTVSGNENQILIGHIWERNVVRKKAAVCGEERCVTSLKTVAKETNPNPNPTIIIINNYCSLCCRCVRQLMRIDVQSCYKH